MGTWSQKNQVVELKIRHSGRDQRRAVNPFWHLIRKTLRGRLLWAFLTRQELREDPGLAAGITYPDWLWDARRVSPDKIEIIVSEREKPSH